MKIVVIGLGYVGLSSALLISQKYSVAAIDSNLERLAALQKRISPFTDLEIEQFLARDNALLCFTDDKSASVHEADFLVIATPTNYDEESNYFDTSSVDSVIREVLDLGFEGTIIIKSTIPVGYTEKKRAEFDYPKIVFSPEFLREGKALFDNLYPSRIIVGAETDEAKEFANILKNCALREDVPVMLCSSREAEAIKLFSNTYLAMRIAFFNELDTYAMKEALNTEQIVRGVGLDPRIGMHYNNPSFGYGGYCLPKDTKQLLANFEQVPNNIIGAIVEANNTRKQCIADTIIHKYPEGLIGIYKLAMKKGSDNFRSSAIVEVMEKIKAAGREALIYEPSLTTDKFMNTEVESDLGLFKKRVTVIVANRMEDALLDVRDDVFTRDIFESDI